MTQLSALTHVGGASFACMRSLACGRPGDSALLLACMFGVLLLFHMCVSHTNNQGAGEVLS
jgi:hypothetical protein